ncbi:MAG: cupin domain-containing protein [Chloroflexi bacterium]|nr:cupin domain-containing protein [Chloroflexota bacterium]
MAGYYTNIRERTQENENFREILFTGHFVQLTVMSLEPGEDIGLETYLETDQFICVEEGNGKAILDGLEYELKPGSAIVIPAGTEHNILNTCLAGALKLYTVYIPPDYADGTIYKTKSQSTACEPGPKR